MKTKDAMMETVSQFSADQWTLFVDELLAEERLLRALIEERKILNEILPSMKEDTKKSFKKYLMMKLNEN